MKGPKKIIRIKSGIKLNFALHRFEIFKQNWYFIDNFYLINNFLGIPRIIVLFLRTTN